MEAAWRSTSVLEGVAVPRHGVVWGGVFGSGCVLGYRTCQHHVPLMLMLIRWIAAVISVKRGVSMTIGDEVDAGSGRVIRKSLSGWPRAATDSLQ